MLAQKIEASAIVKAGLSVDDIFKQYPLYEIRDLAEESRNKYNDKKNELRKLVGDRYRDLLTSADEIVSMESLVKIQDRDLYDVCFNERRTTGNNSIEKNLVKLYQIESQNESKISAIHQKKEKIHQVILNSNLYLELSKIMNINSETSLHDIQLILNQVDMSRDFYQSKDRKSLLRYKLKEIEVILFDKISYLNTDELIKLNEFLELSHSTFGFDITKFNALLLKKILSITTIDNLKFLLQKFQKFSDNIKLKYSKDCESVLSKLETLVGEIGSKQEKKLELYDLIEDKDYLKNISYLSNGLIYPIYQEISIKFEEYLNISKFIKIIELEHYNKLEVRFDSIKSSFKDHSIKTNNLLLTKYLESIQ